MHAVPLPSPFGFPYRRLLQGALAGFIATAPMTISMLIGWRFLPRREKYSLPPRLITEEMTERVGVEHRLDDKKLTGLTLLSHFGYGAAFGAIYALFEQRVPLRSSLKGALSGVALWAGSYLGWLPVMNILAPATQQPWRRNLLMIIAHVIWGVTLGEVVRKLTA
jgi:uncharacterized membrane protein YagU involved in acid resistance